MRGRPCPHASTCPNATLSGKALASAELVRTESEDQWPLPKGQRLRVALLGYRSNPYSGGQGVYLKYVARGLASLGHQVTVISGEPYPHLDDNIDLVKLPGLNLYAQQNPTTALRWHHFRSLTDLSEWLSILTGGFPEPYTFGRRVWTYLKQHQHEFDVVHDNQCLSYGTLRLQDLKTPLATTIHHPITHDRDIALAHEPRRSIRLLIRRWHHFLSMQIKVTRQLDHIVTVSDNAKQDIAQAFGVAKENITVISNGVDATEFQPQPHIPRKPWQLITTASADQPLKGTQHLIPAIAELHERYPQLRLTFIGKAKPGGTTDRLIRKHNLEHCIEFRHGISVATLVDLYAQASIAVVPSEYEGFGLPAAEAMACGVAVVSTNGGALPEVVADAGVIVEKADPSALANAIATLLDDEALRDKLGAQGRKRMLESFTWQRTAFALTNYYHQVRAS